MSVDVTLSGLAWARAELGGALEVYRASRLRAASTPLAASTPPPADAPRGVLRDWLTRMGDRLRADILPATTTIDELPRIADAAPALWRLPDRTDERYLLLLEVDPGHVIVAGSDGREHRLTRARFLELVTAAASTAYAADADRLLAEVDVPRERRAMARARLIEAWWGPRPVGLLWLLRPREPDAIVAELRTAGLARDLIRYLAFHGAQVALLVASWRLLGPQVLDGRLETGWVLGWLALILAMVPFQIARTWAQARLAVLAGGRLKRRLLRGALGSDPDAVRAEGSGDLLGRAIESEALEMFIFSGGLLAFASVLDLGIAAWVMGQGAGGAALVALLVVWVMAAVFAGYRHARARHGWTRDRLTLTGGLVERMDGHRTRLAQLPREEWHRDEDPLLAGYHARSHELDDSTLRLVRLTPRGFLVASLLVLAPVAFAGLEPTTMAIAIGGVLLAVRGFEGMALAFAALAQVVISLRAMRPLLAAVPRAEPAPLETSDDVTRTRDHAAGPLLWLRDVRFTYPSRTRPALRDAGLEIARGDRVRIEGHAGSGKSTLASLLAGMRTPQEGELWLEGLDRRSQGDRWRDRVVLVPQYHENHVFAETLAFNLLLGRPTPHGAEDLAEAQAMCEALGLRDLLDRMPGGMQQRIGDSGWQLSHGERARVWLARALLQRAPIVIVDEGFAALDPQNLRRSLGAATEVADTLLVIAHR